MRATAAYDSPMRVVLLTGIWPPDVGGPATHGPDFARFLQERGHAVEAVTDASPYRICPNVTPNFQRLIGLRIGPGFRKQVRERLGGTEGCTHLVELLGPVGTTAFQTVAPMIRRDLYKRTEDPSGGEKPRPPPALLNTWYAFSDEREVVARQWPEFAKNPAG